MDIHTKFNVGDKVYILYSCGTGGSDKPFYTQRILFHDKNGKEQFIIEGARVQEGVSGRAYHNVCYDMKDWHEIFLPDERSIFYSKEEAIKKCHKDNLESCRSFYHLDDMISNIKRSDEENQKYINEIHRLEELQKNDK